MTSLPLTRILIKLFATGFYRVHAGFLALLFGTVVCYCIFIIPLNETHLEPAQRITERLIFTLSLLSSPVMMVAVFIIWFIYTYKSWQYIRQQLQLESNLFVFYSVTSFARLKQFQSWALTQAVILLPALVYALITLVVGIIFHYYLAPLFILGYVVLLIVLSAALYMRLVNRLADAKSNFILSMVRSRAKPLFTLFLYHIVGQQKLTYLLTKAMAWVSIVGLSYFFSDIADLRAAGIIMLLVSLAHAVLVFQEFRFEQLYLGFVRNFPVRRARQYLYLILLYTLLLLPEGIALLLSFPITTALLLFLFALGMTMLFRCMLLVIPATMRSYLWCLTAISVIVFVAILFRKMEWVALLNLPISCILFYKRYYRVELPIS